MAWNGGYIYGRFGSESGEVPWRGRWGNIVYIMSTVAFTEKEISLLKIGLIAAHQRLTQLSLKTSKIEVILKEVKHQMISDSFLFSFVFGY